MAKFPDRYARTRRRQPTSEAAHLSTLHLGLCASRASRPVAFGLTPSLFLREIHQKVLNESTGHVLVKDVAPHDFDSRTIDFVAAAIVDMDVVAKGDNSSFQSLLESVGVTSGTRLALGQLRGQLMGRWGAAKKAEIKKVGLVAASGTDREDLQNLLSQLREYGLFFVPSGELESWLPSLARGYWATKPEWLTATFTAMGEDASAPDYLVPSSGDVWDFLRSIKDWLHNPQRKGMTVSSAI